MGATRALLTLRDARGVMLWVNSPEQAAELLKAWCPHGHAAEAHAGDDEVRQRAAVVEAGLATAKVLTGKVTTPLSTAVRALRQLNAAVADSKHQEEGGQDDHAHSGVASTAADLAGAMHDGVRKRSGRQLRLQVSEASTACTDKEEQEEQQPKEPDAQKMGLKKHGEMLAGHDDGSTVVGRLEAAAQTLPRASCKNVGVHARGAKRRSLGVQVGAHDFVPAGGDDEAVLAKEDGMAGCGGVAGIVPAGGSDDAAPAKEDGMAAGGVGVDGIVLTGGSDDAAPTKEHGMAAGGDGVASRGCEDRHEWNLCWLESGNGVTVRCDKCEAALVAVDGIVEVVKCVRCQTNRCVGCMTAGAPG
mmetsp:Transcript_125154/g.249870  ORF Transcript_125154/g.249870 Transcript_125154/m.249870 type:complete len:359 (+) Transcript_125154:38-1114(+)|eukprot:CAMPEP_0172693400 /NCGR_PEP_ID=MMETSP1074-20121228/25960_1 /TAXON_ID=2916 /ORGANISM="Ceratium fusus, Strain PA161109" /LENGTH=358 /DNA_ID=CAMNT_0013513769 /DNA_START=71 /DNA_END=1147 /DNA_ORIENTATION=-